MTTLINVTIEEVEAFRLPAIAGDFKGQTLGEIARTARGLLFLSELSLQQWLPRHANDMLLALVTNAKYYARVKAIDQTLKQLDA